MITNFKKFEDYSDDFIIKIEATNELIKIIDENIIDNRSKESSIKMINLLDEGAYPNIKAKNGQTPLTYAATICSFDLIYKLIEVGADIEAKNDNGDTPIMRAAINSDLASMRILLEAGASLYCKNKQGHETLGFLNTYDINRIISKYPEQYKDYLKKKEFDDSVTKFNL